MSKRLPYPDFKNGHVDVKVIHVDFKSMLILYKLKQTLSDY